jgi:hypothetical protein
MEITVEMNYVAVLVATVAAYFVGWMWHGPVFGKKWMALEGFTPESMKSMKMTAGTAITLGFVATLITASVLGWLGAVLPVVGVAGALQLAFWPWFGFTMTTLAGKWLWEGKSFALFAFNAIHGFVALFVMALVLVLWK